jgi:hypothetical protein
VKRPARPEALPIGSALLPAGSLRAICQEGRKFFTGGREEWQRSLATRLGALSEKVGQPERRGKIVEILGDEQHPRFKVRWDDAHETVLVPGPDVSVESGS